MKIRSCFRIRFQEFNKGRDGGLGPVKSFKTSAKNGNDAARKLKKRGKIISIRKIS